MKKLNILQINSSSFWGGGEIYLKNLANGLVGKGHHVTIAIRKEISRYFSDINTEIEVLPLKNSLDLLSIYKLSKIIRERKIDIIHLHGGIDYWLGILARKFAKVGKLVITRHIQNPLGNSNIHKKLYRNIDRYIAVSKEVKKMLITTNGIPSDKIDVIYNGIDINKYKYCIDNGIKLKRKFNLNNQDLVICVIGRLCEEKNQEIMIKVARKLNSISNIKFLIVGEDNSAQKSYKKKLEKEISYYNLGSNIILTGFYKDVTNIFGISDIIVIPSKKEAFGMVAIEAMAMKKPVIASNVGGLKEIIDDQINGFLVPVGDADRLSETILKLYKDSRTRDIIGSNGYETVLNKFTLSKMVEKVEKNYYLFF